MKKSENLTLWENHGDNLLVLQPFMDSLIVGGEGCYLIDADGHRILDLAAGQFCSILGHNHKGFVERVRAQLETHIHLGDQYVSPGILKAAKRLTMVTPGDLNKVVFLSTGSEANECAMRMAKVATGRTGMLAFTRGYYGISLATRTLSSISDYPWKNDFQPAPANQHKLLTPTCRSCPIGRDYPACETSCLDVSLEMIDQHLDNIAAVIVEPIISAGGMILPPRDYMEKLYTTAHKIGALFIVDEAQTGFGRCGKWFDVQNYEIEPDILVVSKTAGNGFPAAAVIVSDTVAKKLEDRCFTHLSSHQNDPLTAAVVHAVIDIIEEESLIEHSRQMGEYFVNRLLELKSKYSLIADVRGRGLMIGMELAQNSSSGKSGNLGFDMAMLCEHKGLHITFSYYDPVVRFIPPLVITRNEIDETIHILDEVLHTLCGDQGRLAKYAPQNRRSGPFIKRLHGAFSPARVMKKVWTTSPEELLKKLAERL